MSDYIPPLEKETRFVVENDGDLHYSIYTRSYYLQNFRSIGLVTEWKNFRDAKSYTISCIKNDIDELKTDLSRVRSLRASDIE